MNKALRAEDFDPYTTIFDAGSLKRNIFTFRINRTLKPDLSNFIEQKSSSDTTAVFDAKHNMRTVRSAVSSTASPIDGDLLKMAEAALNRQDTMIKAGQLDSNVEILASDLSKLFD